jgi:hypothetical protein
MDSPRRWARVTWWAAAAGILIAAFLLRAQTLGKPIEAGTHDLGMRQALAARNFLVHGIVETRGAMVLNGGPAGPDELEIYSHHPTLLPLILAGAFAAFGDTLEVYRLTLIAISLATIALLMAIVRATLGDVASLVAGWVCAVCPLCAFNATGGDILGDGLNLFTLAGVSFRVLGRSPQSRAAFAAELGCYTLAALFDWSGILPFGIPLVDALVRKPRRAGLKRGFLALGAGVLVFGLIFSWAHFVVASRFPDTDKVGGVVTKWTVVTIVDVARNSPDLMWFTLRWWADNELVLWTLPILIGAALGLGIALVACLRGRFLPSGGRLLVLLFTPAVAYVIVLPACFLGHLHAALLFLPALAVAAGVFARFVSGLGIAGRCAVVAWAAWCGWQGMVETRRTFESLANPVIHEVALAAAARSAPDTLLVTPHLHSFVLAYDARRNVLSSIRYPEGLPKVAPYLAKHPGAEVLYLLPPPTPEPPGHPEHGKELEIYIDAGRALEARSTGQEVAGWRIYSLR